MIISFSWTTEVWGWAAFKKIREEHLVALADEADQMRLAR